MILSRFFSGRRPQHHDHPLDQLAAGLVARGHTTGGLILCRCGGILTPIVAQTETSTEISGLGCLHCLTFMPVYVGVLAVEADGQSVTGNLNAGGR